VPFDLPKFDPEKVVRMTITGGENAIDLARKDGAWRVMPADVPADDAAVTAAIKRAAELEVGAVRSTNPGLRQELGVAEDGFKVVLVGESGPVFSFFLGNETGDKKGNFIRKDGGDRVYATVGKVRPTFDKKPLYWRMRKFLGLAADDVEAITIERAGKTVAFKKTEKTWGFVTPPADLPPRFRLDERGVSAMASTLANLYASDFVDDAKDLAALGLQPPRLTVSIVKKGAPQPIVLQVGNAADKRFPAKRADGSQVYLLAASSAERFDKDAIGFRDLTVSPFDPEEARQVRIAASGRSARFVYDEAKKVWALAETTEKTPPGFVLDPEKVRSLVATAARFRGTALAPDSVIGAETGRIAVTLTGGATRTIRVGKPAGEKEVLVAGDDGLVYRAAERAAARLSESIDAFKTVAERKQRPTFTPDMLKNLPPEVQQQFLQKQRQEILQRQLMQQFMRQQGAKEKGGAPEGK
jgi:hypothetical protein